MGKGSRRYTLRQMIKRGFGLGVYVVCRMQVGHAPEYWAGGGIVRAKQRWSGQMSHAFGFSVRQHAVDVLHRLRERDGRVDDSRFIVDD